MLGFVFRPEAMDDDHAEFYQYSRGLKIVVSLSVGLTELAWEGQPIDDDKLFRVGLQGYHYKNLPDVLRITEEEVQANAPVKVLATSALDVLDELLSSMELVTAPEDLRWITVE